MFSQLLRYPAYYAVIGLAGFGFGVWFRRSRWVTAGRPGSIPGLEASSELVAPQDQ
ncbi:hypothetical protein IUT41_07130 [Mycobacteroides abscessus subsp. abscessus]|nr:hypothetical protein [Mycobacteroides abscessus subsp. abscessus]